MNVLAIRAAVASAIPILGLLAFLAFNLYGLYLGEKVGRFRVPGEFHSKDNRWNPELYPPEAAPWLTKDRRWARARVPVWLGIIVVSNLLYLLVKPR